MVTQDKNLCLGELIMVKEEDIEIKEEELETKPEVTFYSKTEERKRSLSPCSYEVSPGNKRQCTNVEKIKSENEEIITILDECRDNSTGSEHDSIKESPTIEEMVNDIRITQPLNSQTKQMVMNIYDYFRNANQKLSEIDLQVQTAAATGLSVTSVQRIKRQAKHGRLHSPPPSRIRTSPVVDGLSDFAQGCMRREIMSFYERGEIPTLSTLLDVAKKPPISFHGGRSSFNKFLKKIGFRYIRVSGGRQILIEKDDVVASRFKFLRRLDDNRSLSSPRPEVYIGEMWVSLKSFGLKLKSSEKMEHIVVHAGGEEGFVPGVFLISTPQTTKTGYRKTVLTSLCFRMWFQEQLIPNLQDNTLIIVDNAPSHSELSNKIPNRSMKKCDIIDWLKERNIAHDMTLSKSELLHVVKCNREKLPRDIEVIASECGHEVLRLPPHHNHLNPIELIWDQVKSEIISKYQTDQEMRRLDKLIKDAVSSVTEEDWREYMHHIREVEQEYKTKDEAIDRMLENLTFNLEESNSDDDDDDD